MDPENDRAPNEDLPIPGDKDGPTPAVEIMDSSDLNAQLAKSKERSIARLSCVSAPVAQRLAYKDMPYCIYFVSAMAFYCLILGLSLVSSTDIGPILDLNASIAISA